MRKIIFIILACVIVSCNSNKPSSEQAAPPVDTTPPAAATAPEEMPPYDASNIDSNAPVVMLTIKATGNSESDMKFDQSEIRVKEGSTVMLTLVNESKDKAMQQSFVLIQRGTLAKVIEEGKKIGEAHYYTPQIPEVLIYTGMVGPGQSEAVTFPAPARGEYEYISAWPGRSAKMHGKFIVEPAAI